MEILGHPCRDRWPKWKMIRVISRRILAKSNQITREAVKYAPEGNTPSDALQVWIGRDKRKEEKERVVSEW
jgi:hypothetical protein